MEPDYKVLQAQNGLSVHDFFVGGGGVVIVGLCRGSKHHGCII
jgi:hypothetical protein